MNDVDPQASAEPINAQEQTAQNQEKQPIQQPEQNANAEPPEDPNWRAFREARKKDRSEREAAEKRAQEKEAEAMALKTAMEALLSKSAPVAQQNYFSESIEESEDERIEKKVQAAIAAREAQAEQMRYKKEQEEYPQRLNKSYPDFQQTISQENLDYLDYHYPEVSRPLKRLQDGFDKWEDIYKALKKFVPNSTTAKKEAARAEANFNKPKSISSTGITQPGESKSAHIISEERKASNWERMQKTLKGVS